MRFDEAVLLYGAGREARSTRAFLKARAPGQKVYVAVDSGPVEIEDAEPIAPDRLDEAIAARRFGLIVKSPGVPLYKPVFAAARAAGIATTSNLNLWADAYRAGRRVIAISGTKGKSTTATLVHLMLTCSGVDAGLAGNVGLAPLDIADRHETVVFELSSYQTADMDFSPDIAGLTNLYPEHLDWHGSLERYRADKLRLIEGGDFPVALGAAAEANPTIRTALGNPARLVPPLPPDLDATLVAAVAASRLMGAHNLDNARLAARLALAGGAHADGIMDGIARFAPLPHRLEAHTFGGTVFVNDSIATTPEATKAALAAYSGARIALIAGGHERGQDYAALAAMLEGAGVTVLATLPVTGSRLAQAVRAAHPAIALIEAGTLSEAMTDLSGRRDRFDTVILSPAAPSYNQFRNFEERGRRFLELAEELFD